jgi:hypothetical protein
MPPAEAEELDLAGLQLTGTRWRAAALSQLSWLR